MAAATDSGNHNKTEEFYIGDDISDISGGSPPRATATKISESPDTKRQATEAAGQPRAVPSASSIDRKTQAAADRMHTGEEEYAFHANGCEKENADQQERPEDGVEGNDRTGNEAAWGGPLPPLPLGN
jgi:hypothetical protein